MDIEARIKRRQRQDDTPRLIQDYEALSPVAHVDNPSDRGPVFERLLDHLDPVFDGQLPPNAYIHGPVGAGKSAVVTALFTHLRQLSTETQPAIYTSTRAASPTSPEFVYVDMRETTSDFSFYRRVLDSLVEESVPRHGISTKEIQSRIHDLTSGWRTGAVLAVDHVDEGNNTDVENLIDLFAGLPSNVSWIAVGRTDPDRIALTAYTAASIPVEPYQRETIVDLLTARASEGLVQQAFDYDQARRIADWADGNAHDALTALFIAADRANRAERTRLAETDVDAALDEIPQPSVSLSEVLTLPVNKQAVLRALVDLDDEDRASVTATTKAISSDPDVDLSPGTVKRFLYEMAEAGVVERVQTNDSDRKGRPPSRVELRFSPTAFRRLYDLRQESNG